MCDTSKNPNFLIYVGFKQNYLLIFALVIILGLFLLPQTAFLAEITPEKIIELTNNERKKNDYEPLKANQYLTQAANDKARALFENQIFQHNIGDKKFSSWIKNAGYNYVYAGENLAINFNTSDGVMQAWMDSPLHKKNVINQNFQEIGVAVSKGKFKGTDTVIVVQVFGTPLYRIDRLISPGYDLTFESLYSQNNLNQERLLTHSASRYLSQGDTDFTLKDLPVHRTVSLNNLFDQVNFNPDNISNVFLTLYMVIILTFSIICFKLYGHHYRLKG